MTSPARTTTSCGAPVPFVKPGILPGFLLP
jgi:hypothetical protein